MARKTDEMQGREGLEDLFAAMREERVPPSDALMARVLADAMAHQPRPDPQPALKPGQGAAAEAGQGLWRRLAGLFGGAGALAGMGTAAVAGLFIGFVQPVGLGVLEEAVLGTPLETVELIPSVETLFAGN
ncbi:MAG: dihydroorotate dehydrogenase [Paracoccaceae bacterium]